MELKSRLFTRTTISIVVALTTVIFIHVRIVLKRNEDSKKPRKESVQFLKDLDQNILCYQSEENDYLYSADYSSFPDSDKLIFFHETSCKGGLDSRQACSIESAARSNPDWKIYVLFAGPVDSYALSSATFKTLLQFNNVQMKRIHLLEYSKGTPMEKVFVENYFNSSSYPVHHASDAIRFLTLHKHGGVHLDLDMIVMKSFNNLSKTFFARQHEGDYNTDTPIGTAILRLAKDETGRLFANVIADEFVNNFYPTAWDANGPKLLRNVLGYLCVKDDIYDMSPETCHGMKLYPPQYFFPQPYENAYVFFEKFDYRSYKDAFTIHIWNKITRGYSDIKSTGYERLAEKYCPSIFKLYGGNFGW